MVLLYELINKNKIINNIVFLGQYYYKTRSLNPSLYRMLGKNHHLHDFCLSVAYPLEFTFEHPLLRTIM